VNRSVDSIAAMNACCSARVDPGGHASGKVTAANRESAAASSPTTREAGQVRAAARCPTSAAEL